MLVNRKISNLFTDPLKLNAFPSPVLHRDVSQQDVQAYNLVRSPITMHPLPQDDEPGIGVPKLVPSP